MEQTTEHDFSNLKIRSSATGLIMTPPKEKGAKDRGELGETAKSYLISLYIKEVYDREKEISTKQMSKGTQNEGEGIKMLSHFYQEPFIKNEERFENDFQVGHPDIIHMIGGKKKVFDTKLSWDIFTFMPNISKGLDKLYWWQIQSYLSLISGDCGEVNFVLTNTPEEFILAEKRKLLYQMNVISEESPEYIEAAAGIEINMIYPDIPLGEKILCFPVERDDEAIEQINQKVIKCREFLKTFQEKHLNFNKTKL